MASIIRLPHPGIMDHPRLNPVTQCMLSPTTIFQPYFYSRFGGPSFAAISRRVTEMVIFHINNGINGTHPNTFFLYFGNLIEHVVLCCYSSKVERATIQIT